MPDEAEIPSFYLDYYTHDGETSGSRGVKSWAKHLYRASQQGLLANRYGYGSGRSLENTILSLPLYLLPGRRAWTEFSVMHLPALPGGRVLDVGCGDGTIIRSLDEQGWQAEGVDPDEVVVAGLQTRGVKVSGGTLEDQEFPTSSFDAVTMSHVIEHVHDPRRLLQECRRVLRPEGYLSIVTPNANSWGHARYGRDWFPLDPPRHLRVFTPETLTGFVQEAGLIVERVDTSLRWADGVAVGSRMLRTQGRFEMEAKPPIAERVAGKSIQLWEWVSGQCSRGRGEEIILLARA